SGDSFVIFHRELNRVMAGREIERGVRSAAATVRHSLSCKVPGVGTDPRPRSRAIVWIVGTVGERDRSSGSRIRRNSAYERTSERRNWVRIRGRGWRDRDRAARIRCSGGVVFHSDRRAVTKLGELVVRRAKKPRGGVC